MQYCARKVTRRKDLNDVKTYLGYQEDVKQHKTHWKKKGDKRNDVEEE